MKESNYDRVYAFLFGEDWNRAVVRCDRCDDDGKVWESDVAEMKVRVCPDCDDGFSIVDERRLLRALGTIIKTCRVWSAKCETFDVYGRSVDVPLFVKTDRRAHLWRRRGEYFSVKGRERLERDVSEWRCQPPNPLGESPDSWKWAGEILTAVRTVGLHFDIAPHRTTLSDVEAGTRIRINLPIGTGSWRFPLLESLCKMLEVEPGTVEVIHSLGSQ